MEHHSYDTPTKNQPSYLPVAIIAAVLALFAWILLHNYHEGGYIWDKSYLVEGHEGAEGGAENSSGREEHGGPASAQEPEHGGDLSIGNAATGRLDTLTGNFIYETGTIQKISIGDTASVSAGANSSEAKLVQFLKSGTVDTADKTKGWITLDRFYFETGSSRITKESQSQLNNIATIMKQYPAAVLKIGGYTDNTGNPSANLSLSANRADAAKNALVGLGIPATRLQAEGYGQEHPVADNASSEGKARNRRVDVRVVKK
jgi:outer membrane protein OmpA-like peptidoglycan-associated protein